MVERRIGLTTRKISTRRGPVKAAHSSQIMHGLADRTGTHVDLSYTHEKLSGEDDAQHNYLFHGILWDQPKTGSGDPDEIEFLVQWEKPFHHPTYDEWERAESFLTVYNSSKRNYC